MSVLILPADVEPRGLLDVVSVVYRGISGNALNLQMKRIEHSR